MRVRAVADREAFMARRRKKRGQETEAAGLGEEGAESRSRLTPVDIQQKVFRLAFRGYNERDVDEFLDQLTEEVASIHEENKRLREQLAEGGGSPGAAQAADRQAETIVRQAREHAARLMEEAEGRGGSTPGALPTSFLLRERRFLQELASLVQSHAWSLKEEARRARTVPPAPSAEGPSAPETGAAAVGVAGAAAFAADGSEAARVEAPPEEPPVPAPEPAAPVSSMAPEGETPSEPEQSPEPKPEPEPPAEAAWGPAESAQGEIPGEPTAAWASPEPREEHDPLLSAWESAFLAGSENAGDDPGADPAKGPYDREASNSEEKEQGSEPSLRELFWGEE
jgi:DivIVA domain-containing protein